MTAGGDAGTLPGATLVPRRVALIGLALTVAAVQFSIAIGEIFLAVALAAWASRWSSNAAGRARRRGCCR